MPKRRKENTSWLGRYLAQKAIRLQSRNEDDSAPIKTIPTTALQATPALPAAYLANEVLLNSVVQGAKPRAAKKILTRAQRKAERRTWPQQLKHGLSKSPMWALGGAAGTGLAGYLLAKYNGGDANAAALKGAIGGGLAGGSVPVVQAALNKLVLKHMSTKKDKEHAANLLAKHPNKASMPLGDAIGAVKL